MELAKVRITIAVTLTTALGYVLRTGSLDGPLVGVMAGMFLLASGSAAFNQWQESDFDARMERTRTRPIPAGAIEPTVAFFLSTIFMLSGLCLLTRFGQQGQTLLALCIGAVFWYNGLYTYLKRWSAFAAVPGAAIGGIPPVVGYVAAGGPMCDERITPIAMFMFIWQVPHFWLLLLMMDNQYIQAGLPTLTQVFSKSQLRRVTFMWILAAAGAGIILPAISRGTIGMPWNLIVVLASAWLALKSTVLLHPVTDPPLYRRVFVQVNLFGLIVVVCLLANALRGPVTHEVYEKQVRIDDRPQYHSLIDRTPIY